MTGAITSVAYGDGLLCKIAEYLVQSHGREVLMRNTKWQSKEIIPRSSYTIGNTIMER
ncbi:MAG: hypothetical protein IJN66_00615 [Muribaculaceae bacterium]|nr:hypothetical protein [Muribaculaceae bacterium]